jgi:hypothetical protein
MGLGARSTTTQWQVCFRTPTTASMRQKRTPQQVRDVTVGIEHLDLAAESSFSVAFGLIGLHLPHRRLARIDKFQLDRGLAENADDGGLFAAAPDAVIVRGVGDAAHEAA